MICMSRMIRLLYLTAVVAFGMSAALAQSAPASVLERAPTSRDGPPSYSQDMLWLDPTGRTWNMREIGPGRSVWLILEPTARVIDQIGGARPAAAYGTMRLTAGYAGPAMTVLNTATNTTATIAFLPDGTIDEAALGAACAQRECRVTVWNDQTGHGRDAVQTDANAQPVIRLSHRTGAALSVVWDFEATSGGPGRSLVLPPSLTIDSGNMAILWTGRFHNASLISPLVELGEDADAFNFGFWDAHGDFYLGTRNHLGELRGHAALNPAVGLISSSPAEGLVTNYYNHVIAQGKLPSEVHRGGLIGRTIVYKQAGMIELSSLILYDRGLTSLERFGSVQALEENFHIPMQQREIYVADGDSLTQGIATQYMQSYPWYMERLLPGAPVVYDAAWAAKTIGGSDGLLARYDAFTSKLFDQNARRSVISLFGGTNDIQNGASDKDLMQLIRTYALAARKTGFKVVVATIIPRGTFTPKMEAARKSVNEMLRGHSSEFSDGLADVAANPVFSDPNAVANANLYIEDGVHLTDLGNQILAAEMAARVAPLLE
jgi:lysophospholipase L1-like esterase